MNRFFILIMLLMTSSAYSLELDAQTKESLINDSFVPYASFYCAMVAPDDREADRLVEYGIKIGDRFINNVRYWSNRSYDLNGISDKISMFWLSGLGKNNYFKLGTIFRIAEEQYIKDMPNSPGSLKDWEANIKLFKATRYRDQNCSMIGR